MMMMIIILQTSERIMKVGQWLTNPAVCCSDLARLLLYNAFAPGTRQLVRIHMHILSLGLPLSNLSWIIALETVTNYNLNTAEQFHRNRTIREPVVQCRH